MIILSTGTSCQDFSKLYFITRKPQSEYDLRKKKKSKKKPSPVELHIFVCKRALANDFEKNNYINDLRAGKLWRKDCSILNKMKETIKQSVLDKTNAQQVHSTRSDTKES